MSDGGPPGRRGRGGVKPEKVGAPGRGGGRGRGRGRGSGSGKSAGREAREPKSKLLVLQNTVAGDTPAETQKDRATGGVREAPLPTTLSDQDVYSAFMYQVQLSFFLSLSILIFRSLL